MKTWNPGESFTLYMICVAVVAGLGITALLFIGYGFATAARIIVSGG